MQPPQSIVNERIPAELKQVLKKQGYHIVGTHSATKKCRWLHNSLVYNRPCYKEKFYGISSHRCLQASPAILSCLTRCVHCWRLMPGDEGYSWSDTFGNIWDEPEFVAEGLIREHKRIVCGYGALVKEGRVEKKRLEEALEPTNIALSLSGEPTIYPHLAELIQEFKKRGMTVFLVTSGVLPRALKKIADSEFKPTQLYISLTGWDAESYQTLNRPIDEKLWSALQQSLEIMTTLTCPTVFRVTVIHGLNDGGEAVKGFSKMIAKYQPTYVEAKAYMHVGYSTKRLKRANMPTYSQVKTLAEALHKQTGYQIANEEADSRVILLKKK
ncbi:MAG: 4-demethylwyosine synthase TYW1 [Nitrososphaerales archaeon]